MYTLYFRNCTDVLLDDREEFIYKTLINYDSCPDGCQSSEFNINNNYTKCECNIVNINNKTNEIVKLDLKHVSGDNIYKSFLSTLKSTNYKVMRCYNLVFNLKYFRKNFGSIITLIIFIIYLFFMIYYCYKGIKPFRLNISKLMFKKKNVENLNQINFAQVQTLSKFNDQKVSLDEMDYPPKKEKWLRSKSGRNNNKKVKSDIEKIDKNKYKKKKSKKTSKDELITDKNELTEKQLKTSKKYENEKNQIINENILKLDNFELNELNYDKAYELDNRSLLKTYWSVLLREHLFLLTFVAYNDYNIFYIELNKFLIIFTGEMALNCLFFVHEIMHRKYTMEEEFTFVQKIPQLFFFYFNSIKYNRSYIMLFEYD